MTCWPDWYPKDCPPKDAKPPTGQVVFRLVRNDPPLREDFNAPLQEYPNLSGPGLETAAAVSVNSAWEDLLRLRSRIPKFRKRRFIARGALESGSGVILEAPLQGSEGHTNWWIYQCVQVHPGFGVVARFPSNSAKEPVWSG